MKIPYPLITNYKSTRQLPDNLKDGDYPCEHCGEYEYCAGHWEDEELCRGYIPGSCFLDLG